MGEWFREEVTYQNQASLGFKIDKLLCREKSPYQEIMIFENSFFGRVMVIDEVTMLTTRDEFVYHEMIVHPAMAVHPGIQRVLVIGAGDGGTIRELTRYDSIRTIDWVEIDGTVVELSERFLPSLTTGNHDPRVRLMVRDGVAYIKEYSGEPYDLIIIDSTDPVGPGEGLFGTPFYRSCFDILSGEGIIINQAENPHYSPEWVTGIAGKMTKIFPAFSFYQAFIPTYPSGHWLFGFASKKRDPRVPEESPVFADILKYYNREVHTAAFALPNFVRDLLRQR
ncbi:MAG TPA: polyamine aminopropyltransferase [Candidatus Mcinerneyibacteriales bacterium]|nr:polyamine aminopropyltransferase [Candidatus Mcinerneyibacteriales bacterium]